MAKRTRRVGNANDIETSGFPAGLNNILQVAAEVGQRLESVGISYCVIGGVAYQRWGEPRQTVDVDATLFVGFGNEKVVIDQVLSLYESRIESPHDFALQNRILLLQSKLGTGIDLSLGGLPFERRLIERSSVWEIPRHGTIRTCSSEDLVVLKAFASRPQDWIDVEKVIIRQGSRLNRELVKQELQPLAELKEEPELVDQVEKLLQKHLPPTSP